MLFSFFFLLFYFSLFLVLLGLWWFRSKPALPSLGDFPAISILIAARNEENHILTCLQAIDSLQYPKDRVQVLVGDDRSTDRTNHLVTEFAKNHPYVRCVQISSDLPGTKGKANVLAQLAQLATSDFFFITDADIEVPSRWAEILLAAVAPGVGIVTGITTTKGHRLFDRLQALDWFYNLGLMQVVADKGLAVSTMGNNMLITREAYEAVGGFEKIPFSITEDVQLFRQVLAKGYKAINVYQQEVLALSVPSPSLPALLQQRRRWMRGSVHLPWYMLLLFIIHSAYYPVWLPFFLHTSIITAAAIFLGKVLVQGIFVKICVQRARGDTTWWELLLLEIYLLVISFILILYFFLPSKVKWKGRRY